jgi:AcrR family transcriptional regulator
MGVESTGCRPLRKDAERNRALLLVAAGEVFEEQGVNAPLEEIARRAGVGIATLYRRFPTREELIEALFLDKVREFAAASERALGDDDPWRGFRGLVEWIAGMQAEDRGFSQVVCASWPGAPELEALLDAARTDTGALLERAKASGSLRPDFVFSDLVWILMVNSAYLEATREVAPDAWRRYLALMLDALQKRGGDELPPPLSEEEFEQAMLRLGHSRARAADPARGA